MRSIRSKLKNTERRNDAKRYQIHGLSHGPGRNLHFTKAAKRLRISQPQLTKNIQELEDTLGVRLFDRDRKTVTLNDAGWTYLQQAKLSIMYAERAFQAAKEAVREADTSLHIGRSPYTDPFLISTLDYVQLPLYRRLD